MSAKQSHAARGKKRGLYNIREVRDFRGRGLIKCELCGFPLRDHEINTHPESAKGSVR